MRYWFYFCTLHLQSALSSNFFPPTVTEDYLEKRFLSMEFTSIEKTPFTVVVFGEVNKYFCTGTLITLEWVVTAAHCMYSKEGNRTEHDRSVVVVAGVSSLREAATLWNSTSSRSSWHRQRTPQRAAQTRRSEQVEVCMLYKFEIPFMHDLTLIRVPAFEKSTHTAPVDLPVTALTETENELIDCESPGFGKILKFQNSNHDYRIKSQTYDLSKSCPCFNIYEPKGLIYQNNWFCPITLENTGLCDGDNGAPLICNGLLRGVSTSIFHYQDQLRCLMWSAGEHNECGAINNLNLFTDLCVYGGWISSFVHSFPVVDPSTCVIKFPWTEEGIDLFKPRPKVNHRH